MYNLNIYIVNNKYNKPMNVNTLYKADSFEKYSISFVLKDMTSL